MTSKTTPSRVSDAFPTFGFGNEPEETKDPEPPIIDLASWFNENP